LVLQKVLVNAPFPILSSLLTGIIYLVSSQSALVVTGVIGAGGALVVLSLVSFGYYLKDLAEEDDKRDAEDRVASRDTRGSRVDTEAGVTSSAHKTGIDGAGELSVAEQPMSRHIVIHAIASEVDDAVSHVEGPEDIEPTAQLSVGQLSHPEGENLVQPARAESPVSITPPAMSTTDETPTLATKSTVVLEQGTKALIDTAWEDVLTSDHESTSKKTKKATKSSKKKTKNATKSSKSKGERSSVVKRSDEGQVGVPVGAEAEMEDVRAVCEANISRLDSKLGATALLAASAPKGEASVTTTDPKASTKAKRPMSGIKVAKGSKLSNDGMQDKGVTGSALQSVKTVVKGGRTMALQTIHVHSDVGPASDRASVSDVKTKVKKVKTVRRPKKKKAKRVKRETRATDNDTAAENVIAAVGKLSLSIARPKRRASLRMSVDENDSECDED
jgi:hypothetical protein